jgi:hypothetical protein
MELFHWYPLFDAVILRSFEPLQTYSPAENWCWVVTFFSWNHVRSQSPQFRLKFVALMWYQ